MRIITLPLHPTKYSCNVYYLLGDWNKLDDVNTLIDAGVDDYAISQIDAVTTGIGQKKVAQIIITHEHFDHRGGVKFLKPKYDPKVFAFNKGEFIDIQVYDGMQVRLGDTEGIILHTPGHSNDSISVYVPSQGVIFTGDLPLMVSNNRETYTLSYYNTLKKLLELDFKDIYPGHGNPLLGNGKEILARTFSIVSNSRIIQ